MSKMERRQKMQLCICTLERLNGRMPGLTELSDALGWEYADVLTEYMEGGRYVSGLYSGGAPE